MAAGPISKVRSCLKLLGWTWPEFEHMVTDEGVILAPGELVTGAWQHEVREGLRRAQWRLATSKRADMAGLELGVDRLSLIHI